MDQGFAAEEEVFRNEVRIWLDRNLPAKWRNGGVGGYREDAGAVGVRGPRGTLAPDSPFAIEHGRWQYGWMWSQAETSYAGSSGIQPNIMAERLLGLPRGR
ncbi:MAG TPA: hypothetical protein VGJ79_04995 [Candidatus Dormibacteraeota bacterium]|jgi:hypothetical protein